MGRRLRHDSILLILIIGLVFFGLVMVFSASVAVAEKNHGNSWHFALRQAGAAAAGLGGMIWLMKQNYHRFRSPAAAFGLVGLTVVGLLVALMVEPTNNTNRFIPLGPFALQPSEFAKLALVVFLAWYLDLRAGALTQGRTVLRAAALPLLTAVLIVAGRDLGTAVVVLLIGLVILWVAGLERRHLKIGLAVLAPLVAIAILMERFRIDRLLIFLDPWKDPKRLGYQIIQALIAVGTGGLTGLGPMQSRQKLHYLPQPHTDFIYAVIAEELGLVGAGLLLAAFCLILWRGLNASLRAKDPFGAYLAVGLTAMLACQALIHMSVALDLAPTKGLPLPLVSYGGSALISALWGSGMLLSVSQRTGG